MLSALWAELQRLETLVWQALGMASAAHLAVDDKPALLALSGFPEGTTVWVKQLLTWWHYRATRPAAEDGITVVYVANGGCWIRDTLFFHAIQWQNRATWHIDFDNGDDWAVGLTQATAIKTFAELYRRVGFDLRPEQSIDIYCYGDNKPTDPFYVDGWSTSVPRGPVSPFPNPPNYVLRQIRVHGPTPRVYYTGAITAIQLADWTTNTPFVVTDVNAIGSNQTPPVPPPNQNAYWYNPTIDWNGVVRGNNHDQQRIRIISGPRVNAVAWTASANLGAIFGGGGGGAIRTSNWCIAVPFGFTPNFAEVGVTAVVPQIGDAFVVEELGLLYLDRLIMKGNGDYDGSGIALQDFNLRLVNGGDSQNPSNQSPIVVDGGSIVFVNCNFDFATVVVNRSGFGAFSYFVNCSGIDGINAQGTGFCYVDAGLYHLQLAAFESAWMMIDADAMIMTGAIYAGRDAYVFPNAAQVWDLPGHSRKAGVMCSDYGTVFFVGNTSFYGTNRLWGVDQTGGGVIYNPGRAYGIAAFDNGRFLYDPSVPNFQNMLTIDGHVQWFGIGRSWLNGEKAVSVDPTTMLPTTLRDTSKANFFATIAAGGFGGRAVDPETGGLIAPYTSLTAPTA